MENTSPTVSLYSALQTAFDHFNQHLFSGELPHCLITLRSSRKTHGYHQTNRFISPEGEMIDEVGIHPGYFSIQSVEMVLATLVHEMVHHWQAHFGQQSPNHSHNREWADKMIEVGLQPSNTGLPGGKETGRYMSDYILPDGEFLKACQQLLQTGFNLSWMDRQLPMPSATLAAHTEALASAGVELSLSEVPSKALADIKQPESEVRETDDSRTDNFREEVGHSRILFEPPPPREKTRFRFDCPACQTKAWAAEDASIVCGECMEPMVIRD